MLTDDDDIKKAAQGIVMSDPMMQIGSTLGSLGDRVLTMSDSIKTYLLRLKARAESKLPQTPPATPQAPIDQLLVKRRIEGR